MVKNFSNPQKRYGKNAVWVVGTKDHILEKKTQNRLMKCQKEDFSRPLSSDFSEKTDLTRSIWTKKYECKIRRKLWQFWWEFGHVVNHINDSKLIHHSNNDTSYYTSHWFNLILWTGENPLNGQWTILQKKLWASRKTDL